jgi:nitrogen regulatory protein PII
MENDTIKALYVIVNAGFSDGAVEISRDCGATGATIINARGTGQQFEAPMGIAYEPEKEIIISLVTEAVADKIMAAIKERIGVNTPAHGLCYTLPVDKMTLLNKTGHGAKTGGAL